MPGKGVHAVRRRRRLPAWRETANPTEARTGLALSSGGACSPFGVSISEEMMAHEGTAGVQTQSLYRLAATG